MNTLWAALSAVERLLVLTDSLMVFWLAPVASRVFVCSEPLERAQVSPLELAEAIRLSRASDTRGSPELVAVG